MDEAPVLPQNLSIIGLNDIDEIVALDGNNLDSGYVNEYEFGIGTQFI